MLRSLETEFVVILNDDDWLLGTVDQHRFDQTIATANSLDVLRIDLTGKYYRPTSRALAENGERYSYRQPGEAGLLEFTPSVWNTGYLLSILPGGESQWQAEISGDILMRRKIPAPILTIENPLVRSAEVYIDKMIDLTRIEKNCIDYMRQRGYLKNDLYINRNGGSHAL
jgi:hypothetical protein